MKGPTTRWLAALRLPIFAATHAEAVTTASRDEKRREEKRTTQKSGYKHILRFTGLALTTGLLVTASLFGGGTASAYVLASTSQVMKWGEPTMGTPGGLVTYSFGGGYSYSEGSNSGTTSSLDGLGNIPLATWKTEIRKAFDAWSAVANIQFEEVADSGDAFNAAGATGDIRITSHYIDGPAGAVAHAYYPRANGASAAGDLHFDTSEYTWYVGAASSYLYDPFSVALHEIGHAIGLGHEPDPPSGVNAVMNPFYKMMNPDFGGSGLLPDDIAGAQFIYGPAVPEPVSMALVASSLLLVVVVRRRRG